MKKSILIACLAFFCQCSFAQWQAELILGISGYSGDLSERYFAAPTLGPAITANIKYSAFNDRVIFRTGIGYGQISANDAKSEDGSHIRRNLNFKSNIFEASFVVEANLINPQENDHYPYLFAGVGAVKFNPYTSDSKGVKTFLQPLGTEGQGLPEYPDRKLYSLTQFCIPYGIGWNMRMNENLDIGLELGARILFTDYLDDVSTTYPDRDLLLAARGATAAELSNRYLNQGRSYTGSQRGNPDSNDQYYFMGVKFLFHIGGSTSKYY
ncbi:MAG: DUF6089 family protein [Bacteroidota bacterium]